MNTADLSETFPAWQSLMTADEGFASSGRKGSALAVADIWAVRVEDRHRYGFTCFRHRTGRSEGRFLECLNRIGMKNPSIVR